MMEKSILQPATLLMMRQEYSLTQLKIMVAMTTKLQTIMHQQLNSLRPMEPEKMITEKDLSPSGGLWVEIDGTELGMQQQGLRQLEAPMQKMQQMPIGLPVMRENHTELQTARQPFSIVVKRNKNGRRRLFIGMNPLLAGHLLTLRYGYYNISPTTVACCRQRTTLMMYMVCERWRKAGKVELSIGTVRRLLDPANKNKTYAVLRRDKLAPARKELFKLYRQQKCCCYFDFKPNYEGSNMYGEPSSVLFSFHVIEDVSDEMAMQQRQQIQQILMRGFRILPPLAEKLTTRITPFSYPIAIAKIRDLQVLMRSRRDITSPSAYAYTVIDRTLKQFEGEQKAVA